MKANISLVSSLALLAAAGSACAAPRSSVLAADDGQIKVMACSSYKRTTLTGVVGHPTTFTFPQGQEVYFVNQSGKMHSDGTRGDAPWSGPKQEEIKDTPLHNNLTLWPALPGESTMTVITQTPQGYQTPYPFRLIALSEETPDNAPNVVFNLICKGGPAAGASAENAVPSSGLGEPAKPRRVASRKRQRQDEQEAARARLRVDAFNGQGGCHYHAHGLAPNPLAPLCPLDNGSWTIMRFKGLSPKPSVYVVKDDGTERLARQHGSGDFVVIEELAFTFRLRLGVHVLDIVNDAYSPAGNDPDTGTVTPSVHRDVIKASNN